jgi:PKD repeat protein
MKKWIFTFLATLAIFALSAQIDRSEVLIEVGTGTGCQYCPGAAMGLHDLYANGDPVAGIEYHNYNSSDPFNTPEAPIRTGYYGISAYPTTQFDGEYNEIEGGSNGSSLYSSFLPIVNSRIQDQTSFAVAINGDNTGDLYNIKLTLDKVAAYSGSNIVVHFALTETDIPYNWQGMSTIDYTQRIMIPDAYGTAVTFPSNNSTIELELSFNFDNTWVAENCELISWIQDNSNKHVLSTGSVMLNDLDPGYPTWLADFEAEPATICESGTAHFASTSIGDVLQYQWSFEGGYPETSDLMNPNVYYAELGEYDVQLVIYDGTRYDTAFKSKYIGVHELPEVDFAEVGDVCNEDWDPYTLTQGSPEGGVYSGGYITDGMYFHPTDAGVGEHTVTYTYVENGCENSADQIINVVNCVGVNENVEAVSLDIYPNPTTGLFNLNINAIDLNNAELQVIDIVGKVIHVQDISVNGTEIVSLDISNNPKGIYFVQIKNETQNVSKKVFLK